MKSEEEYKEEQLGNAKHTGLERNHCLEQKIETPWNKSLEINLEIKCNITTESYCQKQEHWRKKKGGGERGKITDW